VFSFSLPSFFICAFSFHPSPVVVSGFPLAAVPRILDSVCRRDIVPNPTFTTSRYGESLFLERNRKPRNEFATSPSGQTRAGQSGNNAQP